MPAAARSKLCSSVSARLGVFSRIAMSSAQSASASVIVFARYLLIFFVNSKPFSLILSIDVLSTLSRQMIKRYGASVSLVVLLLQCRSILCLHRYESKSLLLRWRHGLLRHCSRCAARRHTLSPYLSIIFLVYVLRTSIDIMKDNGFKQTKERSRRYIAQTITDADYTDDIALQANTPAQVESLLHNLERAAASTDNADKMEYVCLNQRGDSSTLKSSSLKPVDKFIYQRSSISLTEKDINTWQAKAWIGSKSNLTDRIKDSFFQAAVVQVPLYGCTTWTLTRRMEKRFDGNYARILLAILNKSWRQHPRKLQLHFHRPSITKNIQVRRARHAKHFWGNKRYTPVDPFTSTSKGRTTS